MTRLSLAGIGLLLVVVASSSGISTVSAQGPATLIGMADFPPSAGSAIAIDQAGGIYFGHLRQWTKVGTTPSAPASIWSRSSTGEVFISLQNGDLYLVGANGSLTFDNNVFGSTPTSARRASWWTFPILRTSDHDRVAVLMG
ncbi:MAG TPA: hypothetical protein VL123_08590 [Candidatus Udaeobacter sp.]|nr:hypothetical protein [Candidatus Udaeobacter sp.]